MLKVNFQDGTKVSNAKVTIDEVDYPVTPARYDGATPLSSTVMNTMQDNIEDAIDQKADLSNVYTKTETDTKLNAKANSNDVYTKTETDTRLNAKANSSDVYTKTETDTKLNAKANSSDVYTKTETDTKLNAKQEKLTAGTGIEITGKNIINNIQGNYSTKEVKIGTWIDGKPLYRKVLTFENKTITSDNNSSECVHNVSNLDFGIVREAYYDFNGENVWCTASNVITTSTASYNVGYKVGSSSIYLKYISDISFSASNTRKWLFIIEYTKTTD